MSKNKKISILKVATGVLSIFILLSLLAAMIPQPAFAADPAQTACVAKHTVKSGETVSSIAATYGVTWLELAQANNLKDPYTIFVGQVLCIPEGATTTPDDSGDGTTTGTSQGPTFTVTEDNNFLNIKTVGYPKSQSHIVKVGKTQLRWSWVRLVVIGRFATDENGNSNAYIRLPKEYRDTEIYVCLKNAFTDKIQCQYFDPFE